MSKKDKVINNPDENTDSKKIQRWSVWTQGPKDAKETQRKFKLTTPGQERDYKKLVGNRGLQRFEQVESVTVKKEETPANNTSGVDMAPNAGPPSKTTKVFMRRRRRPRRVDGRSKAYKEAVKRIKERHLKKAQKEIEQRYSHFAAQANPYTEELDMSNKYLNTKEGSLEQAVLQSLTTETPPTPNAEKATLTLPDNYLQQKEGSLEWAAMKAVTEKSTPYKLPRQLKDPKKEKMVGTKQGTKVVDRNDPKYKKHPEHESVEERMKHEKGDKHDETPEKKAGESDRDHDDRVKGRVSFKSHRKSLDKVDSDELKGKWKDRDDKDIDNDGDKDSSDQYLHRRRQAIASKRSKGKKQNFRDRDDEAQATRSKEHPTAEEVELDEVPYAIGTWTTQGRTDSEVKSDVGAKRFKSLQLRRKTQQAGRDRRKAETGYTRHGGSRAKTEEVDPILAVSDVHIVEKEVDVPDTRRTVDAIRAYYRAKDASRDATSDTDRGKKKKGDKEKAYAKKERGEIDKDDPNWKHRKYHTGIHGEKWDPSLASKDDHATALYKDQWRDRSRADWDKAHGKDAMAKQDRADAGEDRKRMKAIDPKWKHAEYETGERQNGPGPNESKDREIGTDEYAEYTRNLTPGQPKEVPAVGVDNKQAKKNDLIQKAANYIKQRQSTKIDDSFKIGQEEPVKEARGSAVRVGGMSRRPVKDPATGKTVITPGMDLKKKRQLLRGKNRATLNKNVPPKDPNRPYEPRHKAESAVDEVHSPKDRAELDAAIAAYKAKGGETTKLKSKHPKPATTTPARATGKVKSTRTSWQKLARQK